MRIGSYFFTAVAVCAAIPCHAQISGLSGSLSSCPAITQYDTKGYGYGKTFWSTPCENEFQSRLKKANNVYAACSYRLSISQASYQSCASDVQKLYTNAYNAKKNSNQAGALNTFHNPVSIAKTNEQNAKTLHQPSPGYGSAVMPGQREKLNTGVGTSSTSDSKKTDANGMSQADRTAWKNASDQDKESAREEFSNNQTAHQTALKQERDDLKNKVYGKDGELKQYTADKRALRKLDENDPDYAKKYSDLTRKIRNEETSLKTDKKTLAAKNKDLARVEHTMDMEQENTTKQWGGKYGGRAIQKTTDGNNAIELGSNLAMQISSQHLQNVNGADQNALAAKGYTATQVDAIKTQQSMLLNGKKESMKMATLTGMASIVQADWAKKHKDSIKEVDGTYQAAQTDVRNQSTSMLKGAAAERMAVVNENYNGEVQAQKDMAAAQGMVAAQTMMKAMALQANAKQMSAQAAMLNGYANNMSGTGFSFNPNPMTPNDPGGDPNNPGDVPNQVTSNTDGQQGIDAPGDMMNPNLNDGGVDGPAPGQFVAGDPNKGNQNGAAGGNLGGGGSTSAAKDDSKGEGVTAGKAQAGGSFAAGDNNGSGSRFSRSGGGSSGADNSWLEMMKKFLPGNDEVAKNNDRVDLTDRTIASDQPSVLNRSKNIFEEISKMYQKKNSEGAIIFTGDRT